MDFEKSKVSNGHQKKRKWSSRDNAKHWEILAKYQEIYTNIRRSPDVIIQRSLDVLSRIH